MTSRSATSSKPFWKSRRVHKEDQLWWSAPDESIWIGLLRLKLIIPNSRSLKDKRKAVAQVRERIKARLQLSVAEVGHLEDQRHAVMAVTMVSNDQKMIRARLDGLRYDIESWGRVVVHEYDVTLLRPDTV